MVTSRCSFSVTSPNQCNSLASADANTTSIEKDRQHSPLLPPKKGTTTDYLDIEEEGIYSVPSSPMPTKKLPAEERLEKIYQNNSSRDNTINTPQVNKSHFINSRIKQFEQAGGYTFTVNGAYLIPNPYFSTRLSRSSHDKSTDEVILIVIQAKSFILSSHQINKICFRGFYT